MAAELANSLPAAQEIGLVPAGRAQWIVLEERETARVRAAAERIALEEAELVRDRQLDQPVVGVANGSAVTARQRAVAEAVHLAVAVEVAEATAEPAATEEAIAWEAAGSAAAVAVVAVAAVAAAGDAEDKRSVDE